LTLGATEDATTQSF